MKINFVKNEPSPIAIYGYFCSYKSKAWKRNTIG